MPSDTGIPGLSRRRVWAAPEITSHSLVVLTLPRIYLAPHSGEPRPETVKALEKSLDIESLLGPMTMSIDMTGIDRVRLDLIKNTLRIDYTTVQKHKLKAQLVFATPDSADSMFSKIWRRLGADFTLRPYRPDTWELSRQPLAIMFGLAFVTMLASFGLNAIADVHGGNDWVTAGWLPGWRAVCIVGGAAIAAAHVWLYRRLTQPPDRLELVRT
ncbi:hypothetical protein BH11PLA2_BH11PLA2_05080 [soil metagenome]